MTGSHRRPRPAGITVYGCEPDEAELFSVLARRRGLAAATTSAVLTVSNAVEARGGRCVSVGHTTPVTRRELRAIRDAGVVHLITRSIGTDHIDLDAAADLGISVDNVVYAPDSVADFTLMVILMLVRDVAGTLGMGLGRGSGAVGRGGDLGDMTVGVVGTGRIGRTVIERLRAFGCELLACSGRSEPMSADDVPLDVLIRRSDVVSLHLPLDRQTHHILGRTRLESMKRGAYLVNTGRGALVDTQALIDALAGGHLSGAALDVLEGEERTAAEPPGELTTHPFRRELERLPNVIVTPHIAYRTARTLRETVEATLTHCSDFERNHNDAQDHGRDLVRGLLGRA